MNAIIRSGAQFVWCNGQHYRVVEGTVNVESRLLTVYDGDYSSLGAMKTLRFDEIDDVDY